LRRKKREALPSPSIASDRILVNIQATQVNLHWADTDPDYRILYDGTRSVSVKLTVDTILPDEYVNAVIEELQRQQREHEGAHPQVFIRMEIARGAVIEGTVIEGELALPAAEEKKGLTE
jgi:hypothetical protein